MNAPVVPSSLSSFVEYLDQLTNRAEIWDLESQLHRLTIGVDDVADYVHFGKTYRRNLIAEGELYELLCICWRSGQRSPIHNHARSTCGVRVLRGTATETTFVPTPCGQIKATGSAELSVGQITSSADEQMHQVSNLEGEGEDLVTLHIYSPPLRKMDTFSLLGDEVGVYSPEVFEVSFGAGI